MSVSVSVINKDLTLMKVIGDLSLHEITDTLKRFYNTNPTRNIVWDLTEANTAKVGSSDATLVAEFVARQNRNREQGKTAIIAPADLQYGIGRIFGSHAELRDLPFEMSTFRSYREAEAWLGMPILSDTGQTSEN